MKTTIERVVGIGFVLLLCISLSGCSVVAPYGRGSESMESGAPIETDEERGNSVDSEHEASQTVQAEDIAEVSWFSEGVAWVGTHDNKRVLIDENGAIVQELIDYSQASVFRNGVALAYEGDKPAALIDHDGNVVWSRADAEAYADSRYGEDAVVDVSLMDPMLYCYSASESFNRWHGYVVVAVNVDSFSYTGMLTGIVGPDGNWVIEPPAADDAAKVADDYDYDLGYDASSGYPYSEYGVCLSHQAMVIYRTGDVLPYEGSDIDHPLSGLRYGGSFFNDLIAAEEASAHRNLVHDAAGIFKDGHGNVILDLHERYSVATSELGDPVGEDPFGASDYALLFLENAGGGRYVTVVDQLGNQMFEPMRAGVEGALREGAFFHRPDDEDSGYYLTVEGKRLGDVEGTEATPFSEGRAWILADDVWHCIDAEGAVVI